MFKAFNAAVSGLILVNYRCLIFMKVVDIRSSAESDIKGTNHAPSFSYWSKKEYICVTVCKRASIFVMLCIFREFGGLRD